MAKLKSCQPFVQFAAQSRNLAALFHLYSELDASRNKPYELLPIIVFAGFAIEAYLNSLGSRHIKFWDELERLPWKKKVTILHKSGHKDADWSKGPLQFATEVFTIRDLLAHGKPELVAGPVFVDHKAAHELMESGKLEPEWYRRITTEWVQGTLPRFRELMAYLAGLVGEPPEDYLRYASPYLELEMGNDA